MRLISVVVLTVFVTVIPLFSTAASETCSLSPPQWSEMEIKTIKLTQQDSKTITLRSRIADTSAKRAAGYQHVCPEIVQLTSILFVYRKATRTSFHMSNVHADLDIGFFDDKGQLIEVLHMESVEGTNQSTSVYTPSSDFQFALETRAGYFSDNQLKARDTTLSYP